MSTETATITPETTVGDLLRRYPQLDEPLACLVPAYKALSPALRQTVGASMTLHHLASNGNVALGALITGLRAAAGVEDVAEAGALPAWVAAASRTVTLDARPMLAAGAHPLQEVMNGLAALGEGEVYEMITPFVPAPLVDMARSRGFETCSAWEGEVVRTFFRRG
jgi:hypothetical protein